MGFGLPLTILSRNTLASDCYNLRIITVILDQSYWDTFTTPHAGYSCFTLPSSPPHQQGPASFTYKTQAYSWWLDGGILTPHLKTATAFSPNFFT